MKNELLQELAARGFINQASNMDALNDALNSGKLTVYWGTDPTGDSLHVGHLASLMLMRWFQKYGHRPIALVGGATGRIGDPSGRDKGRPMLTDAQIEHNCAGLRHSIAKFIHFDDGADGALMVDNNDWMSGYSHMDFLREFGTDFTVPRMLGMESVRRRLENGMTFLEFNYMTFQAVDFLTLYKKYNCTVQLCGADQWGNSIMGVELVRKKLAGQNLKICRRPRLILLRQWVSWISCARRGCSHPSPRRDATWNRAEFNWTAKKSQTQNTLLRRPMKSLCKRARKHFCVL